MKKWMAGIAAAALIGGAAGQVEAQVFTPTFMSPQRFDEQGIYLSNGPTGSGLSIEGLWRRNLGSYDLGVRAGVAGNGGAILLVGAEFRTPLQLQNAELQTAVTGGVQGAIGDGGAAGFQAGITIGYPIVTADFTVVPYVHPRLAMLNHFDSDDLDLDPLADIGFDLVFPQNLIVRFAFELGRRTADWGLGISWR